jgi:hypothetical protein
MLKKFGSTILILALVVIGLTQCLSEDIIVHDLKTGEWKSLLDHWLDNLNKSRGLNSDVRSGYGHSEAYIGFIEKGHSFLDESYT